MLRSILSRSVSVSTTTIQQLRHSSTQPRTLITGCLGQLGTGLARELRKKYGADSVIATDIKKADDEFTSSGPFIYADALDYRSLEKIVVENKVDWVVHFTALLSAVGENNVEKAINVNVNTFLNVLQLAKNHQLRLFCPSTIGAFGPSTPKDNTPDLTIMRPTTIYGVTKVYMELLGEYYHKKFGVDFRSLRYPGIISSETIPGGGTTDYAVDIFYEALKHKKYNCFLSSETRLPMMYFPDYLQGTIQLLEAPNESLSQRTYNLAAISFTPKELTESIQKHIPEFTISYNPDFRQQIADSWPSSLDDSIARKDWGWKHSFGVDEMVSDMISKLKLRLK